MLKAQRRARHKMMVRVCSTILWNTSRTALTELLHLKAWIDYLVSMDDRGKFIYISIEEMQAVADYIRKHGRVSISLLANNSNQFINLQPKPRYNEENHQRDESAKASAEL